MEVVHMGAAMMKLVVVVDIPVDLAVMKVAAVAVPTMTAPTQIILVV